ncbi:MAG: malate synthase A [Truepera sp.]|nr:malate synthase A [Truepera sp.]
MDTGIRITKDLNPDYQEILTPEALELVAKLHRTFNSRRSELLKRRQERQRAISAGTFPDFLAATKGVREGNWKVAPIPDDLQDRRVEITGPVERKMMINALNSGAKMFMADFEDALTPTWDNVIQGQINARDAVRRTLRFESPDGRLYELRDKIATLLIRPRGWHLEEKNLLIDGEKVSASLFDFGLYMFHNAQELLARGSGPYFYLPKLESHLEARLWNDVFNFTQDELGIARSAIKATVLIETILAAFEMDEILYELRDHAAGLNAGRWDYIFSIIKRFREHSAYIMPDRAQVTMTVPFMRAYTDLLVKTCHQRGAHAIGGMAAFIPNRRDPEVTERALKKVREDKNREAGDGFDGTWVAHPDLVPVAMECFDKVLGARPHQKERLREAVQVKGKDLINPNIPGSTITEAGVRNNISVALQYLNAWLLGTGAVAIFNLMEDTATAEISRAQLWQWIKNKATLDDGRTVTAELYQELRDDELGKLEGGGRLDEARALLDELVLSEGFVEFLTLLAYERIDC